METRENILNELQQVAPNLSQMLAEERVKSPVYGIPEGYFAQFSISMLERVKTGVIKAELNAVAPVLSQIEKKDIVSVEASYFNSFAGNLVQQIRMKEALNELAEVAPKLASLEKIITPEPVPANYFNNFAAGILNKVQVEKKADASYPTWLIGFNNLLEKVMSVVFRPKYSIAFVGLATTVIVAVMMVVKVEQCNDLDCRFAQLSNEEINNYLDNKSDAYSDEVFEMNVDANAAKVMEKSGALSAYKDALSDVDDAQLNAAINAD